MSAIEHLIQQSVTDRLETIAEGIGYIVENLRRLQEAARVLHGAGQGQTSRIMKGFAEEEAAKVLILIDVVRCPSSKQTELRRTVGYFDKHLAKRIYAAACSWRPAKLGELKEYAELDTRSYYLDGPKGVDWIFPNDVKARRERDIYVDYVKDVTEEDGEYLWMMPEADSGPRFRYFETYAVAAAEALCLLGAGSKSGLDVIRDVWRDCHPGLNSTSADLRRRIRKTLERLDKRPDRPEVASARATVMESWPFPMWSLDLSKESRVDLEELRRTRRELVSQFEQVAFYPRTGTHGDCEPGRRNG